MTRPKSKVAVLLTTVFVVVALLAGYVQVRTRPSAVLVPDPAYEARTAIRPSLIPGAGNGLFAVTPIAEGEVIGELGGRLVVDEDPEYGFEYLAQLETCALAAARPYRYLDSREHGGHVSRINFAPARINGVATHLQNARIDQRCDDPYVVFVALRDIEPGEELLASYGDAYEYAGFMGRRDVQAYFCDLTSIDCSAGFRFDP